jgi:pimeloyl-ACP methyl ester carboxylesterase
MYILQRGEIVGLPIIFLHGFLETGDIWNAWLSGSSFKNPVFIPDLPGHGASQPWKKGQGFQEWVIYIKEFIDSQLGCDNNFIVIGHSMGGYLALEMAALFPEKVEKLILLHSTPMPDAAFQVSRRKRQIRAIENGKARLLTKDVGATMFAPKNQQPLALTGQILNQKARECSYEGVINALEAIMNRRNFVSVLQKNMNRALLITGGKDPFMPEAHIRLIIDTFPDLKQVHFPDCGHAAFLEEPDKTIEVVNGFINGL